MSETALETLTPREDYLAHVLMEARRFARAALQTEGK